jgi:hypothetical protein
MLDTMYALLVVASFILLSVDSVHQDPAHHNNLNTHNNLHHHRVARNFVLASNATDHFFRDISNDNWILKASIHCNETSVDLQEGRIMSEQASEYYQKYYWNNYYFVTHEPTFTCGFERKIGSRADGGKWICDPHRINKGHCLVYSIGK